MRIELFNIVRLLDLRSLFLAVVCLMFSSELGETKFTVCLAFRAILCFLCIHLDQTHHNRGNSVNKRASAHNVVIHSGRVSKSVLMFQNGRPAALVPVYCITVAGLSDWQKNN